MNSNSHEPIILSIESSGPTCAVAVAAGDDLVAEYAIYGRTLHDRLLADLVRRIMADTHYEMDDLDAVAVSSGPGSFTGLRIGASLAKGLCFGGSPRLIGVPTLSALAISAGQSAKLAGCESILTSIISYRDNIYYQEFSIDAAPKGEIISATIPDLDKFKDDKIFAVGTSFENNNEFHSIAQLNRLSASAIARAGYLYYKDEKFESEEDFVPLYVQEFQPKTKPGA
ncbi:MAG: tRNA (adenosine(37)-N6)-threonylcarbamoyltransferase complex dimerization subunit type 1 TsaB [Candidatus Kapaibacterium sp.]